MVIQADSDNYLAKLVVYLVPIGGTADFDDDTSWANQLGNESLFTRGVVMSNGSPLMALVGTTQPE